MSDHSDFAKANILVVDDTPANLRLLARMLTKHGYKVRLIPNGELALEATRATPPDMILLDIGMPDINGYEVCTQLKADPKTRDIPIIFISAMDETEDKVKAFQVGGVDYISKPFHVEEVIARVENHLTIRNLQRSLEQTVESLTASNQELDAFAHTVAHDLKTPLGLVVGYADLLRSELNEESTSEEMALDLVDNIYQFGYETINIVEELLLLAGVRKGNVDLAPVDMAAVVTATKRRLSKVIAECNAEVIIPRSWPLALGYGPWLEEVWANYISNALKYGGQPPKVELGATQLPDGRIRFWVRDNGSGLPEEDQALLFTEFTQANQNRVDSHGLGLSIVKRIIEKLEGEVGLNSEVGEGSEFYFILQEHK